MHEAHAMVYIVKINIYRKIVRVRAVNVRIMPILSTSYQLTVVVVGETHYSYLSNRLFFFFFNLFAITKTKLKRWNHILLKNCKSVCVFVIGFVPL